MSWLTKLFTKDEQEQMCRETIKYIQHEKEQLLSDHRNQLEDIDKDKQKDKVIRLVLDDFCYRIKRLSYEDKMEVFFTDQEMENLRLLVDEGIKLHHEIARLVNKKLAALENKEGGTVRLCSTDNLDAYAHKPTGAISYNIKINDEEK
jgi:hypothetical protein